MVGDYTANKVLDKIKEKIGIEQFDNTKILIDRVDKLPDGITLKKVEILMTCLVKDGGKFYPQLSLDHALYDELTA